MARKYAESIGRRYEEMNVLACHIGGGVSVNIHEKGRIVDSIEDDGGPFSIERAGVIPLSYIVDMAYSGEYSKDELMKKLRGMGGVKAHLGTHDLREVEKRIEEGDEKARIVHEAFAYQISKGIGELAPVLSGNIDAIILTGGAARSKTLTDMIKKRVSFIAPVVIMPGENEMESLVLGALRILNGEETAKEYR
jgi:butyrate kinase